MHAVEQLRRDGVVANARHLDDPALERDLDAYGLIVLVRVAWTPAVARLVQLVRTKGTGLLFDVDDLVFEPGAEQHLPFFATLSAASQREYLALFPRLHRTFDACDGVIASTPVIADCARALGKPAWVHRNLLPLAYERTGRWVMQYRRWRVPPPAIVFLSGSNTHDPDLAAVAAPIATVFERVPDARLILGGFARLPDALQPFAARVERLPYLDWRVYPWVFGRSRVAIAPAAAVNQFTNAKSALKFFEAGAFGVPAVCTPTAEFVAAITAGENGLLADSDGAWVEALLTALDPVAGTRLGVAARRTVEAHHTMDSQRGQLAALLAPHARTVDAPAPALIPIGPPTPAVQRARNFLASWQLLRGPAARAATGDAAPTLRPCTDDLAHRIAAAPVIHDAPEWFVGGTLRLLPDGALDATDTDPQLLSSRLDFAVAGWRYLRVRITAAPRETTATMQLFWDGDGDGYDEARSLYAGLTIAEPLAPITLVFDLHGSAWPCHGQLRRLRFDPLDCRGRITSLELSLARETAAGDIEIAPLCDSRTLHDLPSTTVHRPPVDIVIPVYNACAQTEACAESVLRHARGDWRLVLIDDCSPDPAITPMLAGLAARDARIVVRRNDVNRGFTGTANRGLREAAGRDVVLLNSDTLVTAGFLEGLQDCVYADDTTGIVSSLSNNATVCSVPDFCQPNPIPPGHTIDSFGALIRRTSLRLRPELVTAVGFCMYVRAAVIERIGGLDEERFGRGYGEENDYCERALAAGFTVRLADDVFVYHEGEASFGADTQALKAKNSETLEALHPGYFAKVARFIDQNPLRGVHENLRLALQRRGGQEPALLMLLHATFDQPAGGTEFHVRDLVASMALPRVVVAFPNDDAIHVTEVIDGNLTLANQYRFPLTQPVERFMRDRRDIRDVLATIVRLFGVDAVHIQHLLSWPIDCWRPFAEAELPIFVTLHDFFAVCPSLNLINVATENLCCAAVGGPPADPTPCLRALFHEMTLAAPANLPSFAQRHRAEFAELLSAAHGVITPSAAVRDIVARTHALAADRVHVIPHGYDAPRTLPARAAAGPRLRAAVLGMISHPTKGPRHYREVLAATRDLPIEWHIFGSTALGGYDAVLQSLNLGDRLVLHGPYRRGEILESLRTHGIDVTVHLPAAPETFSFTLSESLIAGVPAIVNDRGALPERIAQSGAGVAVTSPAEAAQALARLATDRNALAALQARAAQFTHPSLDAMADAYRVLYAASRQDTATAELTLIDRRLLFDAYHGTTQTDARATLDDLPHYQRWWYPLYYRLAPLVPSSLRQWARDRVAARSWRPFAAFSFGRDDHRIIAGPSVELVDRRDQTATYRSADRDPFFLLGADPIPTRDVRVVRFRMRCRATGYVFAQLYWSHGAEEPFSEEKSVQVPLQATDDVWREYVVRIDDSERAPVWDAGELIHHLRFDPVNVAATIELRDLFLCGPEPTPPAA